MSKLKLRIRLYSLLFIFVGVMGIIAWGILIHFFPSLLFEYYLLVPIYFLLLGIVFIIYITRIKVENEQRFLTIITFIRSVKVFTTGAFAIIFWLLNKAEIKNFIMMVMLFYLLYLFFETISLVQFEKWRKESNKQIQK